MARWHIFPNYSSIIFYFMSAPDKLPNGVKTQKSHKIFPKSDFNLYEGQHQYNILSFVRSRQDNSREC